MKREKKVLLILAGGKGARFGGDKGLYEFEGTPMVKRVLDALDSIVDGVVVAVAPGKSAEYRKLLGTSADIVEDSKPHRGPLLGLKDALARVSGDILILSACDMPFIRADLYNLLIGKLGSREAAVPLMGGYNEPIIGVYRLPPLRKAIEAAMADGEAKLSSILSHLDFISVSEEELRGAGLGPEALTNLNQPGEGK